MTAPVRDRPGHLGTLGDIAAGTVEFQDYKPRPHARSVTIAVNASANGTATFSRVGLGGALGALATGVAVVAGTELRQTFTAPLNQIRTTYTTVAGAFVASAEAMDDGGL